VTHASLAPPLGAPYEIAPGHVLGRYELLLPIAAGGMAMVWAARLRGTRGFQKIVAVKTMLPKLSDDDQFEQMFLDEASLASRIRHPHAVEILDLGEQDGVLFLAMEWIDGVPLNQLMKAARQRGGVPIPVAVRIVMQACAGLHAAHELADSKGKLIGLVHRDISPQNILVTYDGVAKVVDFGVAKATALGGGATQAGQLKGKVSYMAPEQVRGEAIDRRVDVFAMGIVLYALTTGKHPFRKESEGATLFGISSDEPVVAPRRFSPDFPAALEAVLLKSLEKDRERRFASASELGRALDSALPTALRGSDQEVGEFVTSLHAQEREQAQRALAAALERADRNLQSPQSGSRLIETTLSGVSGVSTLSALDQPRASRPPAEAGDIDASLAGHGGRRLVVGVALGVVGLAAILLVSLVTRSSSKAPALGAPSAVAVASPPRAVAPVVEPPATEVKAPQSAAEVPVVSSPAALASSAFAPRKPTAKTAGSSGSPTSAGATSAKPAPTTAKAWKHDPGF
jgi:serine/threonine-protein kinase